LSVAMDDNEFDALSAASRDLHAGQSVLPVAVWILRDGGEVFSATEISRGLAGRLDRPRIFEALKRLGAIGATRELPRVGAGNSAREFERIENSTYWSFADSYSKERVSVGR
jgi:hypothetical protein